GNDGHRKWRRRGSSGRAAAGVPGAAERQGRGGRAGADAGNAGGGAGVGAVRRCAQRLGHGAAARAIGGRAQRRGGISVGICRGGGALDGGRGPGRGARGAAALADVGAPAADADGRRGVYKGQVHRWRERSDRQRSVRLCVRTWTDQAGAVPPAVQASDGPGDRRQAAAARVLAGAGRDTAGAAATGDLPSRAAQVPPLQLPGRVVGGRGRRAACAGGGARPG
ncbi:hypothetical protein LPJ57_010098, partial [Coemansia sp. RSA 486]